MTGSQHDQFAGRTMVMSGGSRGIGLAIALAFGQRGGNVVLLAKTDTPHHRLPGTVHSAVEEIVAAGGQARAVVGDVRNEADVARAAEVAGEAFGGIDVCVNNASVLNLGSTEELPAAKFDLMHQVNVRGTFVLTQQCLPWLRKSEAAHILTLSPPLNLSPRWLGAYPAYMIAKYGMSLLTLGWASAYADVPISANCLWPETTIATAAVANLLGGDEAMSHARSPEIVADAAMAILGTPAGELTGQCLIDVDVVRGASGADLSQYGGVEPLAYDFFVDPR